MGLLDVLFGNTNQIPTVTTILPIAAKNEIMAGRLPILNADNIFLKIGTETHSLSKPDAWRKAVASLRRKNIEDDTPYLYMLSTDGFVNSYASDEEFKKTCREYFNMIGQHGFEAVKYNLAKWLKETSEYGCGDDVTVVMAYFSE